MECCDYIDSDFDVGRAARIVAFVLAHCSVEAEAGHVLSIIEQADAACRAATGRSISGDRPIRLSAVLYDTSNFHCLLNFQYVQAAPEWDSLVAQAKNGRVRLRRFVDPEALDLDRETRDFLLAALAAQAIGLPGRIQRLQAIKDEIEALVQLAQAVELDSLITRLAEANREAARLIGEPPTRRHLPAKAGKVG
jgi:hypothetical protein